MIARRFEWPQMDADEGLIRVNRCSSVADDLPGIRYIRSLNGCVTELGILSQ
jgi:hypothetical protein